MKYTTVTNPRYHNAEHTAILLDVLFEQWTRSVEFVAIPTDIEAHGADLYHRAVAGEFGPVVPYTSP